MPTYSRPVGCPRRATSRPPSRDPSTSGSPGRRRYTGPEVKDADTIARMRVAGRIAAEALAEVGRHVAPGVTTDELDRVGHEFLVRPRRLPVDARLQGLPQVAVHIGQRGRLPRHPGQHRAPGRRHREHRHHGVHRRRARRHRRDVPRGRRRRGGRASWSSAPRRRCIGRSTRCARVDRST